MHATYDLNTQGCLIITADSHDRKMLRRLKADHPQWGDCQLELEALEYLIANSELGWVNPEEIGALTSAPILGIRDANNYDSVIAAWGFMDYALRSFVDDLIQDGKAVFTS